jgi:uncharacterized protein YkwD
MIRTHAPRWVILAGIAAVLVAWSPGGSPASAAGPCTTGADAQLDADEQAFLTLINTYRAQNGLAALKASYMLSRSSAWKSKDMGQNAYFAHDDTPIARSWFQRTLDCGYDHNTFVGENIAAGYGNAQSVFDGWKASPGHNANMLGANYTVIGIGKAVISGSPYGTYWTTVFGGYDDGWAKTGVEPIAPIGSVSLPDSDTKAIGDAASKQAGLKRVAVALGRLDLSRLCDALRDRKLPAYAWLCQPR